MMRPRQIVAMVAAVAAAVIIPAVPAQSASAARTGAPAAPQVSGATPITVTPDGKWVMPLERLGFGPAVRLTGHAASLSFFLPVPDGLDATSLDAGLFLSEDVVDGFLEVRDVDGVVLASVDLGGDEAERRPPGRPISIPLVDAPVRDGLLGLELQARLRSVDDICETAFLGAHLDLNDAAIVYDGDYVAPDTVGTFFPPVLSALHLELPDDPTTTEADAALRTAASVLARYRGQVVDVVIGDDAPDAGLRPFERAVRVTRGSGTGLEVTAAADGTPTLVISGDDTALARQADILATELEALSIDSTVAVADIAVPDDFDERRLTLADLGFTGLQTTGAGRLEIPLNVSQWELGGPVGGLHVELGGTHTPTTDGIQATLEVLVNDIVIHTEDLDDTGNWNATFDVDAPLLRRDNAVRVRVDHTPAGGECRLGVHPFVIQIDPGSFIDIESGQSLPEGFTRFPQVLRGGFVVGMDASRENLEAAVTLLAALQDLAATPLRPQVSTVADATAQALPAIIVAAPGDVADLDLPLTPDDFRVVGADGGELLRLDQGRDFAVLEAFRSGGRDVVVLTYRSDATLASTLGARLVNDPLGWFALTGDTYLLPADGEPVNAQLRGGEIEVAPIEPPSDTFWETYRTYVLGVLIVLIIAFLAWAYPRVVRSAPASG